MRDMIFEKMRLLHTNNFGAYARKILIDGYIIAIDNSDLKALAAEMLKAARSKDYRAFCTI
jgi:hypothetical protein